MGLRPCSLRLHCSVKYNLECNTFNGLPERKRYNLGGILMLRMQLLFIKLYSYLDKPGLGLADHTMLISMAACICIALTYHTCMQLTVSVGQSHCNLSAKATHAVSFFLGMHACCLYKPLNTTWLSKIAHDCPSLGKHGPSVDTRK